MPPRARKPINDSPTVSLNLDTLQREGEPREPFSLVLGGKRYVFGDVQDVDWQQVIAALRNPYLFFRGIITEKDQDEFFAQKMPTWKMNKLMESYLEHYGMPTSGEAPALPIS